ncbi:MAG: hypothetical protein HQL67_13115, partial [Magnetococcales bacterium]|nr:hypothetical protein [Magnetococcales bacterium]
MDPRPLVVMLVDHRTRDLPVAALLGAKLEELGLAVKLVPLEAYKAVLSAYRPALVLFNHLLGSHLEAYSRRLNDLGVLVGVLLNEGIILHKPTLQFNVGKDYPNTHVDLFFAWNEVHAEVLRQAAYLKGNEITIVGNPRFDFYFPPWRDVFVPPRSEPGTKPSL